MFLELKKGLCPFSKNMAFAIYDAGLPIVTATVYLRGYSENVGSAHNTVLTAAYALKIFFGYLKEAGVSFEALTPAIIKDFKRHLMSRGDGAGVRGIKAKTVRQYMGAVKGLIRYWRDCRENDPLFPASRQKRNEDFPMSDLRRQVHADWYGTVPQNIWNVKIPNAEKYDATRYKGLSIEEAQRVMRVLEDCNFHSDTQTMLYYRDRAIWTFLLMSCLRKGEFVRVRLEDVNPQMGTVTLRDRPNDAYLGDLKTGPGEVFVSRSNPYWRYLDSWLSGGRWIAERKLKSRGEPDHGMLFCNKDGGPLTQAAVDHLFLKIKSRCQFGPEKHFHPHVTRHTMASMMLEAGVELTEVQKLLRHQSLKSTEIYARVSVAKLRESLERFWSHYEVRL